MLSLFRGVVATYAMLLLASPALAQSKDDIAAKINSALPDNGRGQITASGLRGLMNSLNAARGQPSGIAELTAERRLPDEQAPSALIDPTSVQITRPGPVLDLTNSHQGTWFAAKPTLRFCSFAGCNPGDHLRSQNLSILTTTLNPSIAELNLSLDTHVTSGYNESWFANTVYPTAGMTAAASNYIVANGQLFHLVTPGTSASSGSGPQAAFNAPPGTQVQDGTARWAYDSEAISDFKAGISNVIVKEKGGGSSWGIANNMILSQGANLKGVNVGAEWDYGNFSGSDCGLQGAGGPGFCVNQWLYGLSGNLSTAGIAIGSAAPPSVPGAYVSAIWLQKGNGNLVHPDIGEDIKVDSSGAVGLSFGATDPANIKHKIATIRDFTTSGSFLQSFGTKTNNVWQEFSTAPVLLYAQGNYTSSIFDLQNATGSNNAILMKNGQKVCWSGGNLCLYYDGGSQKYFLTGVGDDKLMSIDLSGNLRMKGSVAQNVTP